MSELEWSIYSDWHKKTTSIFENKLDGIIYLRSAPEKCLERLKTMEREEKKDISLGYLQELHQRHEEWLLPSGIEQEGPITARTTPILVLEYKDPEDLVRKTERLVEELRHVKTSAEKTRDQLQPGLEDVYPEEDHQMGDTSTSEGKTN